MIQSRPIKPKVYLRSVIAIILFVVWGLVSSSGLLLWLAPPGPRSGYQPLLLGLTKSEWGDIHFWFAVAAFAVTIIHIILDWKALRGCVRYMTTTHRSPQIGN